MGSWLSTSAESPASNFGTTPFERFLLFMLALIIPLEAHIRFIPNFSIMFLMFALLACYVAINRLWCLDRVWVHPVFVAAYVFIGISAAVELANPLSSRDTIERFALMVGGAVLVASLCRDRAALKAFLYGHVAAALWLGAFLFLTSYAMLSGVSAADFREASHVRAEAFKDAPIAGGINAFALTCAKGGIVALAFALGSASVRGRNIFTLIGIFCLVASSLPMSRSAMIVGVVGCTALLKAYGMRKGKVWLLAGLIVASAVFLVPNAIWSRMELTHAQGKESHAFYYENAIRDVNDYWLMGVGAGNYFGKWGFENGYAHLDGDTMMVIGVHNAFVQVLIFWGSIGLLAYLAIIWQAYHCVPTRCGSDPLALSVFGLAVALLLHLLFTHVIEGKMFSMGLGILVAYQRWLAPGNGGQLAKR